MSEKNNFKIGLSAAFLLALMVVGVGLAAAIQLDSFDLGVQALSASSGAATASESVDAVGGALGGERDVVLNYVAGDGSVYLNVDQADNNRLSFSADTGVTGTALVIWDGSENDPLNNNQGLTEDLYGGGTYDGFHIKIWENDLPADITITAYSTASNCSRATFRTPGGITSTDHVDLFISYINRFLTCGGTGVDWENVTSIELYIDATINPSTQLSLEFIDANNVRDFGDAPASYETVGDLARHRTNGLRLGNNVDVEATKSAGTGADGDDLAGADDEDGVVRTAGHLWTVGTEGGKVDFVVKGCPLTSCYLNGWIDWNRDGVFDAITEGAFNNGSNQLAVSDGAYAGVNVNVPAGTTFDNSFYARFRICNDPTGCNVPTGRSVGTGEIEDYLWTFGPTSVRIDTLDAQPGSQGATNILVIGLALGILANLAVLAISTRKDHADCL